MTDRSIPALPADIPKPSAAEMRRLLDGELSVPARLGYTALLLTSLSGAGVTAALLLTEVALPLRTQIALGVITGIGLSWTAFAAWVLTKRRVLLAAHSVVAARMAMAFTAVFTLGALAVGRWGGTGRTWYAAASLGLAMFIAAVILLVRARRRFAELSHRRQQIEQLLGQPGPVPR